MTKDRILTFFEIAVGLVFGIVYWQYDLKVATIALMLGMTTFVITVKFLGRKLTMLQLVSWCVALLLGFLALVLNDESIIKMKVTIINSVAGLIFLGSHFVGKKTMIERFIGNKITAPVRMLRRVNFAAALFLFAVSAINVYVAQNFSTTAWVQFKIFGLLGLNCLFLIGAFIYLRAYFSEKQ